MGPLILETAKSGQVTTSSRELTYIVLTIRNVPNMAFIQTSELFELAQQNGFPLNKASVPVGIRDIRGLLIMVGLTHSSIAAKSEDSYLR